MSYKIKRKVMQGYIPLSDKIEKRLDKESKQIEKGERILKCPFCNNNTFLRSAKEEPCLIRIIKDDEGNIQDDDIGMNITDYTYVCAKCKKEIIEAMLV